MVGGASRTGKGFRDGTDRVVSPRETLDRVRPHLPAMGITRLANVTGLDAVGIPVVMACRPNSRGLAVSQGKGLTLDAAKASAAMESIEAHHAERTHLPLVLGSVTDLADSHPLIDAAALATVNAARYRPDVPLLWAPGTDLLSGEHCYVPHDAVHTDFTYASQLGRRMFDVTTNGLASGNHYLEAVSHAICELIERDATVDWAGLAPNDRADRLVDLDTVDDEACRLVIDQLTSAGIRVAVWDTTTRIGLPAFHCDIAEDPDAAVRPLFAAGGDGCHPLREIALLRALTEAAQSRLTCIAGSRDDMYRREYETVRDPMALRLTWEAVSQGRPVRDFHSVPTFEFASFDEDVALELELLGAAGVAQIVAVDLTRPEFGIPVVRVVTPHLRNSRRKAVIS